MKIQQKGQISFENHYGWNPLPYNLKKQRKIITSNLPTRVDCKNVQKGKCFLQLIVKWRQFSKACM